MKLRVRGNSIRLRLTQTEVTRLCVAGAVEERTDFGGGDELSYRIQSVPGTQPVRATFRGGALEISIPPALVQSWGASDQEGIYAHAGALSIAVEKDFRCLTPRAGGEDETDAYPRPGLNPGSCH